MAHDLPLFGELPRLNQHWSVACQGTNGTASAGQSWIVFTNLQSGDILSFSAQKLSDKPIPEVGRSPWSDAAGSIFPGGYPAWQKGPPWGYTVNFIRNDVVELFVFDATTMRNVAHKALEYTLVFEASSSPNTLAHGYALALGPLRLFVQHTSVKAITSDLAQGMATGLIALHSRRPVVRQAESTARKE